MKTKDVRKANPQKDFGHPRRAPLHEDPAENILPSNLAYFVRMRYAGRWHRRKKT